VGTARCHPRRRRLAHGLQRDITPSPAKLPTLPETSLNPSLACRIPTSPWGRCCLISYFNAYGLLPCVPMKTSSGKKTKTGIVAHVVSLNELKKQGIELPKETRKALLELCSKINLDPQVVLRTAARELEAKCTPRRQSAPAKPDEFANDSRAQLISSLKDYRDSFRLAMALMDDEDLDLFCALVKAQTSLGECLVWREP